MNQRRSAADDTKTVATMSSQTVLSNLPALSQSTVLRRDGMRTTTPEYASNGMMREGQTAMFEMMLQTARRNVSSAA